MNTRTMKISEILDHRILPASKFGFSRCAIMASAGTGKTYQLAMRYIRLLLEGAEPEEIAAVTFSRKAAGEILEKIVSILLELSESQEKLAKAKADGFLPCNACTEDLCAVLRKLLSARRRLHIETNDSFLLQILQGAPSEFGIRGEIRIVSEDDDDPRRKALLETLHSPLYAEEGGEQALENRETLYQILKDCSYGKENATLCHVVIELLKERLPDYLNSPDPEKWTVPGASEICSYQLDEQTLEKMHEAYSEALEGNQDALSADLKAKFLALWDAAAEAPAESPRRPDDNAASFFLKSGIMDASSGFQIKYRKMYTLSDDLLDMTKRLLLHLLAAECRAVSNRSRAVFLLMRAFETGTDAQTRGAGLLTFGDILYLVNKWKESDFGSMQVILERLGTHISHYLLDEFQDTSTQQWNALENLVGEVLSSEEESSRSFFMVGDIKQSIYQWRKGNPALFRMICRHYDFFPPEGARTEDGRLLPALSLPDDRNKTAVIETETDGEVFYHGLLCGLTRSFRSCEPVLRAVNEVFSPGKTLTLPGRLADLQEMFDAQRRKMDFQEHRSGIGNDPERGFAVLFETAKPDGEQEDRFPHLLAELLKTLRPLSRPKPLSVAVLFRWNKNIRKCAEVLRREVPDLPISMEGKTDLSQSMGWAVFRQMLRLAAHPGDQLAAKYLDMLRTESFEGGLDNLRNLFYPDSSESLSSLLRKEAENEGCPALFRRFRRLFPSVNMEADAMRLIEETLMELQGDENLPLDRVIEKLDTVKGHLAGAEKTVQLMTIHQSKGLGFDIVILADEPLIPDKTENFIGDERTETCFFTPKSIWENALPRVRAIRMSQREKVCYEKCCLLYVAMTRAKRGLYMFIKEESGNAGTLALADILRAGLMNAGPHVSAAAEKFARSFAGDEPLKVVYSEGDPNWIDAADERPGIQQETSPASIPKTAAACENDFRMSLPVNPFRIPVAESGVPPSYRAPSAHGGTDTARMRFSLRPAADFGTEIHRILAQAEWLEKPSDLKSLLERSGAAGAVSAFLEEALSRPQIFECFRHPDVSHAEVWREKAFLLRKDADVVSGIMDRAVIEYDPDGQAVRATVLDFKTDRLDEAEEFLLRYRIQLEEYRFALASLTGLDLREVTCVILALRPGLAIRW